MADEIHVRVDKLRSELSESEKDEGDNISERRFTTLGHLRYQYREYIAEFWGTFIMIAFGDGVIMQTILSNGNHGDQVTINICWGIAVIIGIYTSGGISGAHLNPAITLALAIFRSFPWKKVLGYFIAQGAGAFLAVGVLYLDYRQAFDNFDHGNRTLATAGSFSTYPAPFLTIESALFDQVLVTAILAFGIFAINDMGNTGAGKLGPLIVGLLVIAIGMAFGWQTGYAINPARDLGPRLFAYIIYGGQVFQAGSKYFSNYWWIPIVGPFLGGPLGALIYDMFMFAGEGPVQHFLEES